MKRSNHPILGALFGLSLVAACRGPYNADLYLADGANAAAVVLVRIPELQSNAVPAGQSVEIHGVVVTAIDTFGAKTGDFWVEEPDGGPFSGVHVFGAPVSQVADLSLGDVVAITGGVKSEFALPSDTSMRTVTELQPPKGGQLAVIRTGTGVVPDPHVLDAVALGQMSAADRDAEYEKWEGVLITVQNVSAQSAPKGFGSTTPFPDDSFQFDINGKLVVESTQAAFPTAVDGTSCFASITGVEDYFFNWLLLPRTTVEMVGGGTACPAKETGHAACSDGVDNDGNGFADCMDLTCQISDPLCTPSTTIADVQTGAVTGNIILDNVYVSAVSFNKRNFWISQSLRAAPNQGVYVFGPGAVLDAGIVPGAKVKVTGSTTEFNDNPSPETLTEIRLSTVTLIDAPSGAVAPVTGQTVETLTQSATAEPYEGVLVTLENVRVTTLGTSANFFVATLTQNGAAFPADDDIYRFVAADMNACYASITGLWTYLPFSDAWGFFPVAVGTGVGICN